VESILLFFARAGSLNNISFFLFNNRVLGVNSYITLCLRTHMTIYFEHLKEF
jgi:hypothetical protein